jgi:hypothetical protein
MWDLEEMSRRGLAGAGRVVAPLDRDRWEEGRRSRKEFERSLTRLISFTSLLTFLHGVKGYTHAM